MFAGVSVRWATVSNKWSFGKNVPFNHKVENIWQYDLIISMDFTIYNASYVTMPLLLPSTIGARSLKDLDLTKELQPLGSFRSFGSWWRVIIRDVWSQLWNNWFSLIKLSPSEFSLKIFLRVKLKSNSLFEFVISYPTHGNFLRIFHSNYEGLWPNNCLKYWDLASKERFLLRRKIVAIHDSHPCLNLVRELSTLTSFAGQIFWSMQLMICNLPQSSDAFVLIKVTFRPS